MTTPESAPPQLSPDGRWWWDGRQWVPADPNAGYAPPQAYGVAPPGYGAVPQNYGSLAGYNSAPASDTKAVASLVLAIVWLGGLGSIGGVVLGHLSRSESRKQGRPPSGLALAGLIIGYFGLVVPVLLVLLFAIAVPVFFSQVDRGHVAQIKVGLRNAAVAEEMYSVDHERYTDSESELMQAGYVPAPDVLFAIISVTDTRYCLGASYRGSSKRYYIDSAAFKGAITETPCS